MEKGFTKGPDDTENWTYVFGNDKQHRVYCKKNGFVNVLYEGGSEPIARLIAESPNLLEVCKALLKIVKGIDALEWCIQIHLAEQAIAKAEGKEEGQND